MVRRWYDVGGEMVWCSYGVNARGLLGRLPYGIAHPFG